MSYLYTREKYCVVLRDIRTRALLIQTRSPYTARSTFWPVSDHAPTNNCKCAPNAVTMVAIRQCLHRRPGECGYLLILVIILLRPPVTVWCLRLTVSVLHARVMCDASSCFNIIYVLLNPRLFDMSRTLIFKTVYATLVSKIL